MSYIPRDEEVILPWERADQEERDREHQEELAEIMYERLRDEKLEKEFNKGDTK